MTFVGHKVVLEKYLCDALWELIIFNQYSWTLRLATNTTINDSSFISLQSYSETTIHPRMSHIKGVNIAVNSKSHSQKVPIILKLGESHAKHTRLSHLMVFFCLEMQSRRKWDRSSAEWVKHTDTKVLLPSQKAPHSTTGHSEWCVSLISCHKAHGDGNWKWRSWMGWYGCHYCIIEGLTYASGLTDRRKFQQS